MAFYVQDAEIAAGICYPLLNGGTKNMKHQLKIVSVAALAAAFTSAAVAEEMVKLELELPKPLFAGTPKAIKTPNLERKPVIPEIMVPKGTENLAAGKAVTSSDDFPVIGELEYVTDGDKDGADGSYVELGPGVQWVQIDLGAKKTLYAVALWHYHAQACLPRCSHPSGRRCGLHRKRADPVQQRPRQFGRHR